MDPTVAFFHWYSIRITAVLLLIWLRGYEPWLVSAVPKPFQSIQILFSVFITAQKIIIKREQCLFPTYFRSNLINMNKLIELRGFYFFSGLLSQFDQGMCISGHVILKDDKKRTWCNDMCLEYYSSTKWLGCFASAIQRNTHKLNNNTREMSIKRSSKKITVVGWSLLQNMVRIHLMEQVQWNWFGLHAKKHQWNKNQASHFKCNSQWTWKTLW